MAAASPAHQAIGFVTAAAVAFAPVLTTLTLASLTAAPAAADPKPTEQELRKELKQLNAKVDGLIERYNLKRVELADARKAAEDAEKRLVTAEAELSEAEQRVAELALLQYQNGGMQLPALLTLPDGRGAALLEQLTAEQQALVDKVAGARDEKKKAVDDAAKLAAKIEADAADVVDQREEAEGVIKDIQKKLEDLVPFATGRRSDGSWAPQLPSGSDNITPRTRLMKTEIAKNFALPFSVGCFRGGSSGEHPLGRACDFMMSTGGSMPTATNATLGDRIAEWAIANRAKLGVKYVIWKQRINHGSGWSGMSNRGSITENHFDHVHISMH
ncbi:hypothetical protein OUY22_20165 [Nonomuraea sp. MCN248]|uniref:ARB-07466-like C-terminal domain-containing protein n=1 Tax=Nonomuraea corallina TaxID=2989783 RepID=A0ABT4SEV6_9ACTN|nr:hypothetical protein [Nonomuraea corallina]MDA0635743.1 hypothetical protein [Nonomuraea corallina]